MKLYIFRGLAIIAWTFVVLGWWLLPPDGVLSALFVSAATATAIVFTLDVFNARH